MQVSGIRTIYQSLKKTGTDAWQDVIPVSPFLPLEIRISCSLIELILLESVLASS